MTKKEKAIIAIMIPVAIISLVFYVLVTEYSAKQQSLLVYPEGTLSDSLFVSQNNSYTKNSSLPNAHAFHTVPYYVDVMAGNEASVGDGSIIQASEDIFIYLSEYNPAEENAEGIMLEEFPSALLIDYNPIYTYSQKLKSQTGYINGFETEYLFNMITVSNGEISRTAYVAAYDLISIENTEVENYPHIMMAVITTNADSQSFAICKNVLDAMALTVRYDDKLAKKIERAKQESETDNIDSDTKKEDKDNNAEADKKTEESKESEESNIPPHEQKKEYDYDFTELIEDGDEDPRFIPFIVEENYEDLYIIVKTDIHLEDAVMTLYSADRKVLCVNTVSEDGLTNTFHAGKLTEDDFGLLAIKVNNYTKYSQVEVSAEDKGAGEE